MSRTFRKDDSGHRPEDTRRNKRREKFNSHWSLPQEEDNRYNSNRNYRDRFELDTDSD